MKKIKIKICNYDPNDKCSYGHYFLQILKRHYEVELSENPDYLFYNESTYEHLKYDCIKIFYTGENITPNFNLCDYAIGFDYMEFEDRYYRLPIYLVANFYRPGEISQQNNAKFTDQLSFTHNDLSHKTDFCSFVYSNYLGDSTREEFFTKLSMYKKVNAGGAYLNNVGGRVENKLDFETKHKFSIAFENSSRNGYTTEKLPTALMAKTIPIYWGNPLINEEFNEERFVNCHAYKNFDEVVERIKEIDNDDDVYLKMINQPVSTTYDFDEIQTGFESFLKKIIDQPIQLAQRRTINPMRKRELEKNEGVVARYARRKSLSTKVLATMYQPFKKSKLLDRLKQKYLKYKSLKK
ncbi:MAG: glycosyltransferase family 10 [bacterium]